MPKGVCFVRRLEGRVEGMRVEGMSRRYARRMSGNGIVVVLKTMSVS